MLLLRIHATEPIFQLGIRSLFIIEPQKIQERVQMLLFCGNHTSGYVYQTHDKNCLTYRIGSTKSFRQYVFSWKSRDRHFCFSCDESGNFQNTLQCLHSMFMKLYLSLCINLVIPSVHPGQHILFALKKSQKDPKKLIKLK